MLFAILLMASRPEVCWYSDGSISEEALSRSRFMFVVAAPRHLLLIVLLDRWAKLAIVVTWPTPTRNHASPRGTGKIAAAAKGGKRPFPVGSTAQLKDTYDRPIRDRRNVRCHKRKFQSCAAAQSAEVAVISSTAAFTPFIGYRLLCEAFHRPVVRKAPLLRIIG